MPKSTPTPATYVVRTRWYGEAVAQGIVSKALASKVEAATTRTRKSKFQVSLPAATWAQLETAATKAAKSGALTPGARQSAAANVRNAGYAGDTERALAVTLMAEYTGPEPTTEAETA